MLFFWYLRQPADVTLFFEGLILYQYDLINTALRGLPRPGLKKQGMPGRYTPVLLWLPLQKKEDKMPKMKTKSGAKKRFRLTASGKVRGSAAFLSHNLRRRSQKMKRQARGTMILNDADARIVKRFLPYA